MTNESNSDLKLFSKRYFTVSKAGHPFSRMSVSQAHEPNNKVVKVNGGAIGILKN